MSVHLIHVGFPKTGSTYLQHWFANHPQIEFRTGQLAGCDSVHDLVEQISSPRPRGVRVTSCQNFSMPSFEHDEWSGIPAAQSVCCATLHDLFPTAHILIVTRGFKALLESGYSELVRLGTRQSFAEFVQWLAIFEAAPEILNYDRVVAEYSHTFDNRVTVLPYELLRNDSRAFLAIIEAVLGIDAHPASPLRENVRLSADELHWYPRIAHAIERLPLGDRVRRRLLGAHRRGISSGRMRSMVRMLSRLKAGVEDGPSTVPDDVLERVRGGATKLVTRQWHRPYAAEYLG